MAKFDITYGIVDEGMVIATDAINITLNKKDLEEIEATLVANNFSPYFAELPERLYNRCCRKALEAGPALCEKAGVKLNEEMAVAFSELFPLCIAESLSEGTAAKVKANVERLLQASSK